MICWTSLRNQLLTVLGVLFLGIILSCQNSTSNKSINETEFQSLKDSLTVELTELHQQGHINGFGVAIVSQEEVLYAKGIGMKNIESQSPFTGHTLQNIGSVSKTFIGLALLKAQELGKLQLDDPVTDYLPFDVRNPTFPEDAITLRQLATHTSTIMDTDIYDAKSYVLKDATNIDGNLPESAEQFNAPDAKTDMMTFLERVLSPNGDWYQEGGFLQERPGAIYEYTNIGATLAAAALETAVNQPFKEFVKENILQPLHMSSSGWSFEDVDMNEHATLYADPSTPLPFYSLITYPDGGLITCANDLARYLKELINGYTGAGHLLSNESYKELFTPQLSDKNLPDRDEENAFDDEYNSGIFMGFTPKGYVGHTGGDPGITSFMFFNPDTNTGRLLMINTSIINEEGVNQYFGIWNALGTYEDKFFQLLHAID